MSSYISNIRILSACWLSVMVFGMMPATIAIAEQTRPALTGKPYKPSAELDTSLPRDYASDLPDLGDISQTVLSPQDEQRIADQIMREVYVSDEVLQDPEITDYLQALGNKLAAASPDKRQTFNFFVVNDNSINAFAMPGGVIGVHTGLFIAANNESELASVLGHEIGHVTQRHLARILASQKYDTFKNIAATALALLVARSNPQLATGAMVTASASTLQRQLDYTREHEREADRVGLAILDNAGFDVRAMPAFFTTMQRGTRFVEGSAPSFLRTHPLTAERIADVSNRVQNLSYKQSKDSLDFYLARARIRAGLGLPQAAIEEFESNIRERRFNSEVAEHYGLAYAYLRKNDVSNSAKQLVWLKANASLHPNIENLAATIEVRNRQLAKAQTIYAQAIAQYPLHRALVFGYANTYVDSRQADKAIKLVNEKLKLFPNDPHFYEILAKAYTMKGQALLKHQAQAEAYFRQYDVNRAVEQMEMAAKAKDGNFYERSIVEARLKQLRRQQDIEKELKG
ncbi:MAG: peptidase M48 [Methylophilaceae bacterium 17-44-8]|nr:MAG: peptidase M48 [Methylophilaceae bacterium 17-44-8]